MLIAGTNRDRVGISRDVRRDEAGIPPGRPGTIGDEPGGGRGIAGIARDRRNRRNRKQKPGPERHRLDLVIWRSGKRFCPSARPGTRRAEASQEHKGFNVARMASERCWSEATKIKDPVQGGKPGLDTVARRLSRVSGGMRRLILCDVFSLRPFLALYDFKLYVITLLQAFIAFRLDGAVVHEHIRAVIPTDETEPFCVIEPFHFAFDSRHVPYSERPPAYRMYGNAWGLFDFPTNGCCHCLRRDAGTGELTFSRGLRRYYPLLWLL